MESCTLAISFDRRTKAVRKCTHAHVGYPLVGDLRSDSSIDGLCMHDKPLWRNCDEIKQVGGYDREFGGCSSGTIVAVYNGTVPPRISVRMVARTWNYCFCKMGKGLRRLWPVGWLIDAFVFYISSSTSALANLGVRCVPTLTVEWLLVFLAL